MGNAQRKAETEIENKAHGAGPRGAGAVTATTGGEPEDMNQMPPTFMPDEEGPVYDGSQLARGESIEKVPTEENDATLEP